MSIATRLLVTGINVADVEAIVQAAVGGQAATQVIQGEKLFDLVVRMKPEFRENAKQIGNLLVGTPSGQQIPLSELANIHEAGGASFIYRETIRAISVCSTALKDATCRALCSPASDRSKTFQNPCPPDIGSPGAESMTNCFMRSTRCNSLVRLPCFSFS